MIFSFFFVALIVFIGFRVFNFFVGRVKIPLKVKNSLFNIFPVIELFTWIAYIIWITKVIYDSRNYFALISMAVVFCLIAFPLFLLIRDFVSGLFLKLQSKIVEGTYIEIDKEIKGKVIKTGHLRIDIEDKLGNIVSISYNNIRSRKISRPGSNQNLEKVTIIFEFQDTLKVNDLILRLKKELMNTPWIPISKAPIIENTKKKNGSITIEVGAFVLDKSYAEKIKTMVTTHFASVG